MGEEAAASFDVQEPREPVSHPSPAAPARRRMNPALLQRWLRNVHLWLGMLAGPSLLFFALTGGLQVFGWHERHAGYTPPPLIEKLGMVHKNQRFALGRRPDGKPGRPVAPAGPPRAPEPEKPTPLKTLLLKWFFVLVAVALFVGTGLGMTIGLLFGRQRRTALILTVAGVVIPVLLLVI